MNIPSLPDSRTQDKSLRPRTGGIDRIRCTACDIRHAADHKARLVNLGLYTLARGEWLMVQAITKIIQARGWQYA